MRKFFELHHNLAVTASQPLPGAQIERNASPAPVIDMRLDGHKGLSGGSAFCTLFLKVGRNDLVANRALAVLSPDSVLSDRLAFHWCQAS